MCEALEGIKNDAKTEGVNEGRLKERSIIVETMRKNGFTEEQIKLALGENYNN